MRPSTALALCLLAGAGLLSWFAWLAGPSHGLLTSQYTRALAAGHAYLGVPPDPHLLALPDPYDPATNQAYRVVDASLYRGRYYLYFGIVPFITVLAPWFRVSGHELPDSYLSAAYCWGAMACLGLILLHAGRRHFPKAGSLSLSGAVLAGSLGGGGLILIRDPNIYQVVIAGAYFHEFLALGGCYGALHDPRRRSLWLAFAGLNVGLAVGCRPSHVIVAALVTGFIVWEWARAERGRTGRWRTLGAVLAPLGFLAVAIAWYNWVRFDSPFDFGYLHALVNTENFRKSFIGLHFVPFNLWLYLLGWPRWSGWFPFFMGSGPSPLPVPPNYYMEQVYGLLLVAPFVAMAAVVARRWGRLPGSLRRFVLLLGAIALTNLFFLSMLDGANSRYVVDFLPYALAIAGLGLLAAADGAEGRPGLRAAVWLGTGLAGLTLLASFCLSFAYSGIARSVNLPEFERAGRIFNQPRFAWERWHQTPLQGYRVRTTLPANKFGAQEPLLVVGPRSQQDFLYLYYVGPGQLRVGYEAIGAGGPVSDLIPVNYAEPLVIDLELGFRWPPPRGAAVCRPRRPGR